MPQSKSPAELKAARKSDALALAELLYDMFKEEERRKIIVMEGQNNAQTTDTN
jgi:hypothetical protein